MTIVERIRNLCDAQGLTLASLERKLDFGNGTIRRWDKTLPSGDKLLKVAEQFNVTVDYLLGNEQVDNTQLNKALFRLSKELEPFDITEEDTDFILTVFKVHKEKNK